MNNKMSNWFKLPVNCLLVEELNGENKDAIQFENVNILTSHHVQKVEMAINEYDRLVRELQEANELNDKLIEVIEQSGVDWEECINNE